MPMKPSLILEHKCIGECRSAAPPVQSYSGGAIRRAVGETPPPRNLARAIHARFAALGGIDLELPDRGPMRPLPNFG